MNPKTTAFVLVDPYNDFFAEDGKIYPRLKEVAQSVDLHQHIRELLAAGTNGGEWYPDFAPREGDIVASEHWGESGFAHTDLDQQLRQHGIEHILLAGLTAPGCVEGTGRWALEPGYTVTLVKDATAAFSKEHLHAAVELNGPIYAEQVLTTAEVTGKIKTF